MILRRIFAGLLDCFLWLFFSSTVVPYIENIFADNDIYCIAAGIAFFIFSFFFYFMIFEVIFFATPAKLLFNLKIICYNTEDGYRRKILLRNILKLMTVTSLIGIAVNIIFLAIKNYSWYDRLLGLDVVSSKK